MNWGLLGWLYEVDRDVERTWKEVRNGVGATAEELAYAAGKCRVEEKRGWCDWFERHNSRDRVEMKERVWRGLLDGPRHLGVGRSVFGSLDGVWERCL